MFIYYLIAVITSVTVFCLVRNTTVAAVLTTVMLGLIGVLSDVVIHQVPHRSDKLEFASWSFHMFMGGIHELGILALMSGAALRLFQYGVKRKR